MRATVVVEQATPFAGRLATAFIEVVLAAAVIVGAIVVGHDLREWRDWYKDAYHPWLAGPRPASEVTVPAR
jgi:hypothetical protein